MTVKIYGSSCKSTRKAKSWFEEQNIPFIYKDLLKVSMSVDEVKHIFHLTEKGTEDIIATKTNIYKELNLDFDRLQLNELYKYIQQYPRLITHPIIFDENKIQIGFNEHDIRKFIPKNERRKNLLNLFRVKQEPQIEGV